MSHCTCSACNPKRVKKLVPIPKGYKWLGSKMIEMFERPYLEVEFVKLPAKNKSKK